MFAIPKTGGVVLLGCLSLGGIDRAEIKAREGNAAREIRAASLSQFVRSPYFQALGPDQQRTAISKFQVSSNLEGQNPTLLAVKIAVAERWYQPLDHQTRADILEVLVSTRIPNKMLAFMAHAASNERLSATFFQSSTRGQPSAWRSLIAIEEQIRNSPNVAPCMLDTILDTLRSPESIPRSLHSGAWVAAFQFELARAYPLDYLLKAEDLLRNMAPGHALLSPTKVLDDISSLYQRNLEPIEHKTDRSFDTLEARSAASASVNYLPRNVRYRILTPDNSNELTVGSLLCIKTKAATHVMSVLKIKADSMVLYEPSNDFRFEVGEVFGVATSDKDGRYEVPIRNLTDLHGVEAVINLGDPEEGDKPFADHQTQDQATLASTGNIRLPDVPKYLCGIPPLAALGIGGVLLWRRNLQRREDGLSEQ